VILWLALACSGGEPDTGSVAQSEIQESLLIELDSPRLLRRVSLDLRGRLPSAAELDAIDQKPEDLGAQIREMMAGPEFEEQLVVMLGERFLTLLDAYEVRYSDYFLDSSESYAFHRSVGEEPLRLMARVVAEDRPWGDIVTTDQTMANDLLSEIWPLVRVSEEPEWSWASYTDGRPAAGILSTNGFWWRYITSPSNKNRGRVATISRLLLCTDILSRPIQFSGTVSLGDDPDSVILSNPDCLSCHASVEPIAATLFGFYWYSQYSAAEMTEYHPERELLGEEILGVSPAWYGQPIEGLVDLGTMVSTDPRFAECAVETVAEMLWRRERHLSDLEVIQALEQVYADSGGRLGAVFEAILAGNRYRAGGPNLDIAREHERTVRMMSPDQLSGTIEALTGFRWTEEGTDMLRNDLQGYRVLAGGVDGEQLTSLQQDPGLSRVLVERRLAEAAAEYAVSRWWEGEEVPIFDSLDPTSTPGDSGFETGLASLHWRLFALPMPRWKRERWSRSSMGFDLWIERVVPACAPSWTNGAIGVVY
jgi:hypothetical protein